MIQLLQAGKDRNEGIADVVFVHGLDGDPVQTWHQPKKKDSTYWPEWLSSDIPGVTTWILQYDAHSLDWRGTTMPLVERAANVLGTLQGEGFGKKVLVFVAHSLGGLLVKQLLRVGAELGNEPWSRIVQSVRGCAFLATPHTGSSVATWVDHIGTLIRASSTVTELIRHEPHLRDLNQWYRNFAPQHGIKTLAFFEKQRTFGTIIVDPDSADPGIAGVIPIAVEANHFEICKPSDKKALIYLMAKQLVLQCLADSGVSPTQERLPATKTVVWIDAPVTATSTGALPASVLFGKLSDACKAVMPNADMPYPEGSYAENRPDSALVLLDRPSVALRGAIELMQTWHNLHLSGLPDMRILVDIGDVTSTAEVSSPIIGTPLDILKYLSLDLPAGHIYMTESAVDACDNTMATFTLNRTITLRTNGSVNVYQAIFADPRSSGDSALVHALFVAHPAAAEARARIIELFLLEFLAEQKQMTSVNAFLSWLREKKYPILQSSQVTRILRDSSHIESHTQDDKEVYRLTTDADRFVTEARQEYISAKSVCTETVTKAILEATGVDSALAQANLSVLLDEYLCAIFSEIRIVANYFRGTARLFDSASDTLRRFDYIIRDHLTGLAEKYQEPWRKGFLAGLRRAAEDNSTYIAAVFHSSLAAYYLNRSSQTSPFQLERLKRRTIYVDTNVLYAARVEASSYHDLVTYVIEQLSKLGVAIEVFPFSVAEYERAIASVDRAYHDGRPEFWLETENPWLLQEFRLRSGAYLNNMSACVRAHSFAKKKEFTEADYDVIDSTLRECGLSLERLYTPVVDGVSDRWGEYVKWMASSAWDMDRWWEFRHNAISKGDDAVLHDVSLVENVKKEVERLGSDSLGPRVLLLTLDSEHLLRLRRRFSFVIGVRQCMDFFLPYMFLNDIPVKEAEHFPNRLLAAQLGVLLARRPPTANEIVAACLRDPSAVDPSSHKLPRQFQDMAQALNEQRLRGAVLEARELPEEQQSQAVQRIADALTAIQAAEIDAVYKKRSDEQEGVVKALEEAKATVERLRAENEKLRGRNRYQKRMARGRKR